MTNTLVVLCTLPDEKTAGELARSLLEQRLCACVNIVPRIRSIYAWEGKLADEEEVLCVIKTTRDRFAKLEEAIQADHPYEVPEVIALPVVQGHVPYLEWVKKSTQ
jgi:periplasmic divalent cation tolerance protein